MALYHGVHIGDLASSPLKNILHEFLKGKTSAPCAIITSTILTEYIRGVSSAEPRTIQRGLYQYESYNYFNLRNG